MSVTQVAYWLVEKAPARRTGGYYMAVAYQLPAPLSDLHPDDAAILVEPNRSMWVFPYAGSPPTVLVGTMVSRNPGDVPRALAA